MNLPVSGTVIILVIFVGGVIAISAFIWAIRNRQFNDFNAGAYVIFDEDEPVGEMTEKTFGKIESDSEEGK